MKTARIVILAASAALALFYAVGGAPLSSAPSCTVAITGEARFPTPFEDQPRPVRPDAGELTIIVDSSTMNVGQLVRFTARVTGGTAPFTYRWTVDGETVNARILQDYNESVETGFKPRPMDADDFLNENSPFRTALIAFYWKPLDNQIHPNNAGPQPRIVKVAVAAADGACDEGQLTINVERNTTDKDRQAVDFYTLVHKGSVRFHRVLNEHKFWHNGHPVTAPAPIHDGEKFFTFHRSYLERFQQWRDAFGYGKFFTWDPANVPPGQIPAVVPPGPNDPDTGENVEHPRRAGYDPTRDCGPRNREGVLLAPGSCAKPKYFTVAGGPGARPGTGLPCDSSGGGEKRLKPPAPDGFATAKLLGCAVEPAWHGSVHIGIGGGAGLYRPAVAPMDPLFWPWHKFVDGIYQDYLTPSPKVTGQAPFQDYFIGSLASVGVTFSEPVTGVAAADLAVNGSPATSVAGSGDSYVFTGFTAPGLGPVSVSLAAGSIVDVDESSPFAGDSWSYTLINPALDADNDGLNDGEEAEQIFTDPTNPDSDGDGMPDGFEDSSSCLNPVNDQAHQHDFLDNPIPSDADADDDGVTDLQEFYQGSDPCSAASVGGIAGLNDGAAPPAEAADGSGGAPLAPIAAAVAAGVAALAVGGWYLRRRWVR